MTNITRRDVLTAGAAMAGVALGPAPLIAGDGAAADGGAGDGGAGHGAPGTVGTTRVRLMVNGRAHQLDLDRRTTVLDALREHLALTGTKKGCDQGQCGACTVHISGERVLSCLTLAVAVQGQRIDTIEGLSPPDGPLHPMQQAFIDQDAFQCGYCTPGQIMSAVALVKEGEARTDHEIRESMSGNLCRCAAYPKIVAAIKQARARGERA
jgi:xanthine dehydrogenase YagT iron-sulfur-binding subunit